MAKHHEDKVDGVMWSIVGTTTTILGMSLGALVLMQQGDIDPVLGKLFVIMSFLALILVEGVLIWRFMDLRKRAAEADDWDEEDDPGAIDLDARRTHALPHSVDPRAGVASQVKDILRPVSKEAERR